MRARFFPVLFVLASLTLVPQPAHAQSGGQQLQRIAAVVNDEIVSVQDLTNRIQMVIVTSRLPRNNETARRLAPQVLRTLIDEQLQLQEAQRLSIAITDDDMSRARADVETRNGLRPGQFGAFVQRLGINPGTVDRQLRAGIAWSKLVQRRFAGQVEVSAEEIDETLARLADQVGQEQKRVSEIFLAIDTPERETEIQQLAERLVTQLRGGASFPAVARQFSAAANANVGGDIGWVVPDQLAPDLVASVSALGSGEISDPIRTVFGYHIMRVADIRVLAEPDPADAVVTLAQVFLPVRPGDDSALRASQRDLVQVVTESSESCDDLAALAQQAGSPVSADFGESPIAALPENLRAPVLRLRKGQATDPIDLPNGVMAVMVCERRNPTSSLPEPEVIRRQLEAQRFEVLAQRYLRDLRQSAFVETRV